MFPGKVINSLKDFHLDIECAGDQKLPYSGYVEVEVGVPGVITSISCLLLVTPDTRYGKRVPVIIGTNVLKLLMNVVEQKHGIRYQQTLKMPDSLYFAFRCLKLQNRLLNRSSGQLSIVKCAMAKQVIIPENTTTVIKGKLDKKYCTDGQLGITQPISHSILTEGVSVTPTLVDGNVDTIAIEISNLTTRPVIIPSNSILCQVQSCQLELGIGTPNKDKTGEYAKSVLDLVDFRDAKLTDVERTRVQDLVTNYEDVFSTNDMDVGLTSLVKHRIQLNDNTPFKQRFRKIPHAMFAEVQQHIKQLLDADIIRHSQSPWASNIVLVRKKDSSLRICVDYRQLNLRTVKDAYALPRIDDLLEGLGGNKYYSVLDMRKGYHQVELEEDHKALTAFTVGPLVFF